MLFDQMGRLGSNTSYENNSDAWFRENLRYLKYFWWENFSRSFRSFGLIKILASVDFAYDFPPLISDFHTFLTFYEILDGFARSSQRAHDYEALSLI